MISTVILLRETLFVVVRDITAYSAKWAHAVAQLVEELRGVRFPMLPLEFFINITFPAALCPWVDSATNKN